MVKSQGAYSSASIPIRHEKKLPMPPVACAMGMTASYYGYPLFVSVSRDQCLLMALLLLIVFVISFLRVLSSLPGEHIPAYIRKAAILSAAAAVGFTLGIAVRRTVPASIQMGLPAENVIAVSGILREDPRSLQGGSGLGILDLRTSAGQGGLRASARGNLTVFFPAESIPRLKEFGRGCEIYIDGIYSTGIVPAGSNATGNNSAGSNAAGSRRVSFRASSLHVVKAAPPLEQFRTGLRVTLLEKFQSRESAVLLPGKPPIWGSLASALLLGVRDDLDTDLTEGFANSGCSHILALSGMHLAIISGVLAFLIKRPLGIRWATLIGAVFIVFYVFVAGSQPSLVRAGIMYLIAAVALWGLLKGKPISLLGMAFIIQLLFQSETGISVSFILSYLALAGILTFGENIRSLFRGRLPEIINGSLSASLGAFIVTAPVVALYFGSLRPIGIIAGLLIVPLSSLFMVLSLGALAAAFLPLPVWNAFDFILTWFYRILEFLVSLAGQVPGFTISNPFPVLIISILLWLFVLFVQKQDSLRRNSVASLG